MTEMEIYARAGAIIETAMGYREVGGGRHRERVKLMDDDPLAYWMGIFAIVELVEDAIGGRSNGRRRRRQARRAVGEPDDAG